MIRLPMPPERYDRGWANQLCSALEAVLRGTPQANSAATFGNLTAAAIDADSLQADTISADLLLIGGLPLQRLFASTVVAGADTRVNTAALGLFSTQYNMPANTVKAGSVVRVHAAGTFGVSISVPTLTISLFMGSATMLSTGAITVAAGSGVRAWALDALLTCCTAGSGGLWEAHGSLRLGAQNGTKGVDEVMVAGTAQIAQTTALVNPIGVGTQWSVANTNNTITQRQLVVEVINP